MIKFLCAKSKAPFWGLILPVLLVAQQSGEGQPDLNLPRFKSQPHRFSALQPWTSHWRLLRQSRSLCQVSASVSRVNSPYFKTSTWQLNELTKHHVNVSYLVSGITPSLKVTWNLSPMSRSTFDGFSGSPSYFRDYPSVTHPLRYGQKDHLKL